jgi:glycerol-3-phosphate dehydrogenase
MVKMDYLPTRMKAYHEYPHAQYGLTSEESIKSFVIGNVKGASGHLAITKDELLSLVSLKWTAQDGLLAKLDDILLRRTTQKGPNEGSVLKWQYCPPLSVSYVHQKKGEAHR